MFNTAVLKVGKEEKFSGYAKAEDYDGITGITIKNKSRALRKLVKRSECERIIINHNQENERIFENRIKKFKKLSLETILPLLDKICRLTAEKYGISLPFSEVYIMADQDTAFKVITEIAGIGRLFSVVCENYDINIADNLYFECGCMSRGIKKLPVEISKESLVIKADKKEVPLFCEVPVIDVTTGHTGGKRVVTAKDVEAADERIKSIAHLWGGRSGLLLYELLGLIPCDSTSVNINKTADEIFLLDRETF